MVDKDKLISVREFEEWLNKHRNIDVSSVLHDVVSHYAAALEASKQEAQGKQWIERWHGSPDLEGWSIMDGRERVAYLGTGPKSAEVSAIVAAHNAMIAATSAQEAQGGQVPVGYAIHDATRDMSKASAFHGLRIVDKEDADCYDPKCVTPVFAATPATPAQAEQVAQDKPDMFWNDADPEMAEGSIHDVIDREWGDGSVTVGDVMEIQQAIRLPNIKVRLIESAEDGPDYFDYEVIEDGHAARTRDAGGSA